MGHAFPKPVTSVVVKRFPGTDPSACCRAGVAEMNGWRSKMEDAHVAFMGDGWSFFSILDGHGGDRCSNFMARRLQEELAATGVPKDFTELCLRLDREFLDQNDENESGSTCTFVLVQSPTEEGGKYRLLVGNIGDSRVLLGRADGSLVECKGTDGAVTTDHKPDHPSERARIECAGGSVYVQENGIARVNGPNGALSVSRAFGDSSYKQGGGVRQQDQPVSAEPEFVTLECDPSDFLLLVCDGISERAFPNRQVASVAADLLREHQDPGRAATEVCRKALQQGSRDNLSCMIVLLGQGDISGAEKELLPGPYCHEDGPIHQGFSKAYEAMAQHAGLSLAQAIELRYDAIRTGSAEICDTGEEQSLHDECECFGNGPPEHLTRGSLERGQWFEKWLAQRGRSR